LSFDDDLLQRETQKSFSVSPFVEQLAQLATLACYRIKTQGYKPEDEDRAFESSGCHAHQGVEVD
jgi:hypothetical protein